MRCDQQVHYRQVLNSEITNLTCRKWPDDQALKFTTTWRAKAAPIEEDKADKKKIIEFVKKLDENKDLHDQFVSKNQSYTDFLKDNNFNPCHLCFSQTCLLQHKVAKSLGLSYDGPKYCKRSEKKA